MHYIYQHLNKKNINLAVRRFTLNLYSSSSLHSLFLNMHIFINAKIIMYLEKNLLFDICTRHHQDCNIQLYHCYWS